MGNGCNTGGGGFGTRFIVNGQSVRGGRTCRAGRFAARVLSDRTNGGTLEEG